MQTARKNLLMMEAFLRAVCIEGADYWTRTNDLLITNELLYQLS